MTNLILLKIGWIKICKGRLYNLVFVCFLRCLRYAPTILPSVWLTLRHTGCQNLSSQDQAHWKKNWMQSIPIELTSSTSLYAEKYFGETFKKLSKQLLSFRFRTLFRSWQGLFWSTWERPLPHFRLSLHSFQGKWGRFPGRTCQRNISIVQFMVKKWSKAWNITKNEMTTISFRNFKNGGRLSTVIW